MHRLQFGLLALVVFWAAGCRSGKRPSIEIVSSATPTLGRFEQVAMPADSPPFDREKRRSLKAATVVPAAHGDSESPAGATSQPQPLPTPPLSNRADASAPPVVSDYDGLVIDGEEMSIEQLVAEVESRNPSLRAMIAAWQAAAQKYPQAVALDDPMFMAMLAPAALGADDVAGGQQLQVTQRFPWPGKRRARGAMAQNEADAAYHEAQDARIALRLMTQMAFYDYYLVRQLSRLNAENVKILEQFRDTAQVRYQTNLVTQQDVLQADVELIQLARRKLELDRMEHVAAARINTLLRRLPDAPLPPLAAPSELTLAEDPSLPIGMAFSQRQDLAALAHRIEAEDAALALAHKQLYPDVDLVGAYNAMMPEKEMWGQVGVGLNIPLYRQRQHAAVGEAQFRVSQRLAEYEQKQLDIQYEVQSAFERLKESQLAVDLYRQKLVSTAQLNVAAARTNYENAKGTFLDLAQAQRQLIELREKEQEAIVESHQRQAELERAIGGR